MILDIESNRVKLNDYIEMTYDYIIYHVKGFKMGLMILYNPITQVTSETDTNIDFRILDKKIAKKLLIKHKLSK
jgi:hypothetical protein